jgi:hypothetical protein
VFLSPGVKTMKRIVIAIALLSSLIFLESCSRGSMYYGMHRGGGHGGCYERDCPPGFRTYSKATVETFSGEVVSVTPVTSRPGHSSGIHLKLTKKRLTFISDRLGILPVKILALNRAIGSRLWGFD